MGMGSILECPKCKKEYQLCLGNGWISFQEKHLFNFKDDGNVIDRSKYDKISNLNELHEFLKLENVRANKDFKNDYYYCDKCKSFEIKFYYYLKSGNKIFRPKYKCERCGSILNHTRKKNIEYHHYCSECNIPMNYTGFILHWD